MAGTIAIDTIQNGSGASVPTTTVINGSAKAWVSFTGVSTAAIRSSFNVSSVTREAAGKYTINYTVAFGNANYAVCGTGARTQPATALVSPYVYTNGSTSIGTFDTTGAFVDASFVNVSVFE